MKEDTKNDSTLPPFDDDASGTQTTSIRMVIQRFRKANILIDENRVIAVGQSSSSLLLDDTSNPPSASVGLLAYISFSKTADDAKAEQSAKTLLNLPILTLGAWGDGSTTRSMLQLLTTKVKDDDKKSKLSVVLVPQANLIAKVKKVGRSLQYHDQIEKSRGEQLYEFFCEAVQRLLVEHESICQGQTKATNPTKPTAPDPSIPPKDLFRQDDTYGSFDDDEDGLPLTMANGDPVAKSARKKNKKVFDSHVKRHEKYLKQGPPQTPSEVKIKSFTTIGTSMVQVVPGSFGKRQGLELYSDMGPFCHVVEI